MGVKSLPWIWKVVSNAPFGWRLVFEPRGGIVLLRKNKNSFAFKDLHHDDEKPLHANDYNHVVRLAKCCAVVQIRCLMNRISNQNTITEGLAIVYQPPLAN